MKIIGVAMGSLVFFFPFFSPILWCCSSGNQPKVYLAKYGDIQNMKLKKS
jgi:hypothetical protein